MVGEFLFVQGACKWLCVQGGCLRWLWMAQGVDRAEKDQGRCVRVCCGGGGTGKRARVVVVVVEGDFTGWRLQALSSRSCMSDTLMSALMPAACMPNTHPEHLPVRHRPRGRLLACLDDSDGVGAAVGHERGAEAHHSRAHQLLRQGSALLWLGQVGIQVVVLWCRTGSTSQAVRDGQYDMRGGRVCEGCLSGSGRR